MSAALATSIIGALGTVISSAVLGLLALVHRNTNGRLTHLENELKLTRQLLAASVIAADSPSVEHLQ